MSKRIFVCFLVVVLLPAFMPTLLLAGEQSVDQLLRRIEQLEKRVAELEATPATALAQPQEEQAAAVEQPVTFLEGLEIGGFVDMAYGYNFNNPDTRKAGNALRVFDIDHNSFSFDLLELYVERPIENPGEAGFRFDLNFGQIADLIDLDPDFGDSSDDFDVQQAYVTYRAPIGNGLDVAFGKFVTHHGAEVIESKDNPNYSRSFLFGFAIPFTHTGVRFTYPFSDKISYTQHIVNGWDNVVDNNDSKSLGGQLAITPTEAFVFYLNWMYGPEQTNNEGDKRGVIDLVSTYQATDKLKCIFNYDYGSEEDIALDGGDAHWQGFAGILDYDLSEKVGVALRGEWFNDDGGSRTGTDQDLYEITLAGEYHWTDHLMTRLEYRHDWSSKHSFLDDDGTDDEQDTLFMNVVYEF